MSSAITRFARTTTAPVRNYFNNHFEMVKDEVRSTNVSVDIDERAAWQRVAELENLVSEMSLYQARVLNRLSDDVDRLAERIDDLDRVVGQLVAVVAAAPER